MVTICYNARQKNARLQASGSYRIETKTFSVGIGSWAAPKKWPGDWTRRSFRVGRPDKPHGYGTYSPCDLAMDGTPGSGFRREPTSGDPQLQLRPDTVPIPSLPPHKPPITSTDGPGIHTHRRVSAVALRTSMALSTASVIVGVRIPTLFRRRLLEGRRTRGGVGIWYREWRVGYRGRVLLGGEDREEEVQLLSSTGRNRRVWERHDLVGKFYVCDTIRVHDLRICYAARTKKEGIAKTIVLDCERSRFTKVTKQRGRRGLTYDVRDTLDLTHDSRL